MIILLFCLLILALIVWQWVSTYKKNKKFKELLESRLSTMGLNTLPRVLSIHNSLPGLVIDENNHQAYLLTEQKKEPIIKPVPFKDILSCELEEVTHTVTTTKKKHSIGRAVAGGVLLGPVGAIVGGASAGSSSASEQKLDHVLLRLTLNDLSSPLHTVKIKDREIANNWQATMSVIIHQGIV
jgi:hypothetical protein